MGQLDSLGEWFAEVCREEFGRNAEAVQAYLERHHAKVLAQGAATPVEIVRRDLLASFRRGVSELMRIAVWDFLERERKRRGLTQHQLSAKAGVSQSTYSKVRTGETSFESITLFLRAMDVPLGALPATSRIELTIEGLLRALGFVRTDVFRDSRRSDISREDVEWLLHMDTCRPWVEVLQTEDEQMGEVIAECLGASVSIRLGRTVDRRAFGKLVEFWRNWSGEWEICMTAISAVIGIMADDEPDQK